MNTIKKRILILLLALLAGALHAERSVTMFVAITGKPTRADIVRKLDALKAAGIDSVLFYPTSGMRLEYLGEEFWQCAATFAEEVERRGMKLWLYDEYNWPSGSCRGRVPAEDPRFRLKEFTLSRAADGSFVWGNAFGPRGWVNLLEPEAVKRFLELTHWEYARRLQRWFKNGTIVGIFTDEPGHPTDIALPKGTLAHARCYEGLEDDYRRETGRDFRRDIEAWAEGDRTNGVWAAYAKVYARRFRTSYYDQVRAVTDQLGIKFCGHLICDDDPPLSVLFNGDPLLTLAGESFPGIDEVISRDRPETVSFFLYALADYVTRKGGRGGMAELFACGPADMPPDRIRRMLWLNALHGVTRYFTVMSVMDASWLDKMRCGFTVTIGEFQPYFAEFPTILDEADRASAYAAKRIVYDAAVRMPQTLLARVHDDRPFAVRVGRILEEVLKEIELSGGAPMLIAEDEACDLERVFRIEAEAIVDEKSGRRFANGAAAARFALGNRVGRRNVLRRRYTDGTTVEFDLNPPAAMAERGAFAAEGWTLTLNRPNCLRVPFSTNRVAAIQLAENLELKLVARHHLPVPREEDDDRIEGQPMCAGASADGPPPYAFALDGQAVDANRPTVALLEGYNSMYRETAVQKLAAGTHTLSIVSGRNDELHFLPNLFVVGDFVETARGLARRPPETTLGTLAEAGLGSFAGVATYAREVHVPDGATLLAADTGLALARAKLGGVDLGVRAWPPFEWEIPAAMRGKDVRLELSIYTSQLPIFGPPLPGQGLNKWLPRSDGTSSPGLRSIAFH